jgi:dienelactone hydrolase
MGLRRASGWIAVATLVVAGTATATSSPATATPPPGTSAAADAAVGTWQVRAAGEGRYVVSWTSPTRFPPTSARPTVVGPADLAIGTPVIAADGRTVRAVVTSARRPDPARLGVVLSGDRLDVRGNDLYRSAVEPLAKPLDLPGTVTLPDDPGQTGPYDVATSNYDLAPVKLAGMPVPIEMVGHVVEPSADAATGPRPLVLFLHGRHSVCYDPDDESAGGDWPCQAPEIDIPSQLGYDYLQRVLASQGYATVSIRANGINGQDWRLPDGGADARAELVEAHLDHWVDLAAAHQVDLDRVVLVGHSRGGEGVDRASIQIPLDAPYRIAGQVLIAPTDFGYQTAPYVPTVTLLPYCDGDVSDLEGQRFTDTARDLTDDDTSLKSSVLVMGANHNYFNTEWTPGLAQAPAWDDWGGGRKSACGVKDPDRLTPGEQQAAGTAYVAGAVHLFASDEQDLLPLFDGSRARVASMGDAQGLSHAIGGGRDERAPGTDTSLRLPVGASTRFCQGTNAPGRISSCSDGVEYGVHPHWPEQYERTPARRFFEMSWTEAGQSGGVALAAPLDLSERRLELRTVLDPKTGPADLRVRITDADGASAVLVPTGGGVVPSLGRAPETAKLWAQTVVADPAGATGIDLSRIVAVDLVAESAHGRLWVADLAAAPAELVAVPDMRVPTVDVGRLRVEEGDGSRTVTAYVPLTITGELTRPGRLVVTTTGQARGDVQQFPIDLAPGQTSGRIPVTYTPDRADDYPKSITQVAAWATHDVMTDSYLGSLTVIDDDPSPRITLRPIARRVAEGGPAQWRVTLTRPVDYEMFLNARVVRSPGRQLTVADLRPAWVERYIGPDVDPDKTLASLHVTLFARMRPGTQTADLTLPTVRDGVTEGRESVALRVRLGKQRLTRTVYVTPS